MDRFHKLIEHLGMVTNEKNNMYKFGAFMWRSHVLYVVVCNDCNTPNVTTVSVDPKGQPLVLTEDQKIKFIEWISNVEDKHWVRDMPHTASIQGDEIKVPRWLDELVGEFYEVVDDA
jgi:hypothetical protein